MPTIHVDRSTTAPRAPFACLVCGGGAGRLLFVKNGLGIAQCEGCGFVQQDPVPTEEECAAMYAADGHYGDELLHTAELFLERDRQLIDELVRHGGSGPLLDVGAGAGIILQAAIERGWEAVGIEISEPNAATIRARLDATVHTVPLHEAPLEPESFGAVTFSHSLEHVTDPIATLRRAAELLRPGGLLHVAVPNWLCAKRTAAGPYVPWIYPHHVTYFRRSTLERALREARLQPLAWRVESYPGADYAFVVALLRRWGLDDRLRRWLRLGERPLEALIGDDVRIDCPPWRFRALLRFSRTTLALWPDRLLCALGRSDELRVTARKPA